MENTERKLPKKLPAARRGAQKKDAASFVLDDRKINVLVMGTSGAGKSTLINAVLGEDRALTGDGEAVTRHMQPYERDDLPFRMIDTAGFEYGLFRQNRSRAEILKWSRESVRQKDAAKLIHIIWFCVDAQSKRIFRQTLDQLREVSRIWKDIPILVVFTKSYSESEIARNERMWNEVLERYKKRDCLNIRGVVSVVAKSFPLDPGHVVAPRGLDVLVSRTNELIPDAKKLSAGSVRSMDLAMKRTMAYSLLGTTTAAAAVVGAAPIPVADHLVLSAMQYGMLKGIGGIYGVGRESKENEIVDAVMAVGATTTVGRSVISAVKAVPGVNIAAAVLNSIVAGTVTFAAGEVIILVFEGVRRGEIDLETADWSKYIRVLFNERLPGILRLLEKALRENDPASVLRHLFEVLSGRRPG